MGRYGISGSAQKKVEPNQPRERCLSRNRIRPDNSDGFHYETFIFVRDRSIGVNSKFFDEHRNSSVRLLKAGTGPRKIQRVVRDRARERDAMKTDIRIVAGSLRGRKLTCKVSEDMRPTPQMVREAFFSILGNAIPGRLFVDIFAGTGVMGIEALSRGASMSYFIERDFTLAEGIIGHLKKFELMKQAKVFRTDAYRWVSSLRAPADPVNVFFSPPFPDLHNRPEVLLSAIAELQEKLADESVIVLQSERGSPLDDESSLLSWERRTYGRNVLFIWQKGDEPLGESEATDEDDSADGDPHDEPADE